MNLRGHAVIQVIKDNFNNYHIIECNARFGGASTLAIASGLDSFYWFILESMGENIDKYPFLRVENEIRQIRYKKDMILTT
jgi:carbamoyl-phosphate synthase large subunit